MFNIGDRIVINSNDYNITTKGSTGVILNKMNTHTYAVRFDFIASGFYERNDFGLDVNCYRIDVNAMKLDYTIQEKVIRKIKLMENRFNKRNCHV